MIFEKDVSTIVMLTPLVDRGRVSWGCIELGTVDSLGTENWLGTGDSRILSYVVKKWVIKMTGVKN